MTPSPGPAETDYRYDTDYLAGLGRGWTDVSFPRISALVRGALDAHLPERILDYGAGSGAYAAVLSGRGGKVDACDVSTDCVAASEGSYDSVYLIGGAGDLPSGEYDMVFSTEVLEHIEDYRSTLRHFHRALRPEGIVFLTTTAYSPSLFTMFSEARASGLGWPSIVSATGSWCVAFLSEARRDAFVKRWCFTALGGHRHGFTRRGLDRAFRDAGFSVETSDVLYILEPIQLSFLSSASLLALLRREDWPKGKRWLAAATYMAARPLNRLLRRSRLLANNLYVVAVRDGSA